MSALTLHLMWNYTDAPLAYLISFRTYGTWLHGDERGSTDRFRNQYRSPHIGPSTRWRTHNRGLLKAEPLRLGARQRRAIERAIRETCTIRKWEVLALNVRINHVHAVVTASEIPERVLNAFKANAKRHLRECDLWPHPFSPWADKGRRLWNERSVARAIDYVLNRQGDELPDFDD